MSNSGYYTQGLELELVLPVFSRSFMSPVFLKVKTDAAIISGLSLAQRLYTPKNIKDSAVQFNDRPFAATLELDYFINSINTYSGIELSGWISLGIIGPAAGGEQLQSRIHDCIESPDPNGWDYQVANDIILNYDFFLTYPLIYKPSSRFGLTGGARV